MGKINKSYLKDKFKTKKFGQEGLRFRVPFKDNSLPISYPVYGPEEKKDAARRIESEIFLDNLPKYQLPSDSTGPKRWNSYYTNPEWGNATSTMGNRQFEIPYIQYKDPTLAEFKSIYETLPRYNQGYASLTDADPRNSGIQAGPLSEERIKELAAIAKEEELRKSYLGKTFGTLPLIEPDYKRDYSQYEGFYEGYNPNRIWTSFVNPQSQPFIGYEGPVGGGGEAFLPTTQKTVDNLDTYPLYAYFLTSKPSPLPIDVEAGVQKRLDNLYKDYKDYFLETRGYPDYNAYEPFGYKGSLYENLVQDIQNADSPEAIVPNFWDVYGRNSALDMKSRIDANPEIQEYIKNQEASSNNTYKQGAERLVDYLYSPQLAEALLAKRHVDLTGMDVGYASSGKGYPVIQNPEAFTLTGYLPITKDMYYTNPEGKVVSYWNDPVKRKEYLLKAGVPENMLDQVYIHTNPFPLEEYKPRRDAQGNVYQKGGKVKSKLKTSYKNRRG
jgi:hypothetical protein